MVDYQTKPKPSLSRPLGFGHLLRDRSDLTTTPDRSRIPYAEKANGRGFIKFLDTYNRIEFNPGNILGKEQPYLDRRVDELSSPLDPRWQELADSVRQVFRDIPEVYQVIASEEPDGIDVYVLYLSPTFNYDLLRKLVRKDVELTDANPDSLLEVHLLASGDKGRRYPTDGDYVSLFES